MDERGGFILLTFDLHNLNFSYDLQEVMGMLRFCADRVRVVLHRADLIDAASQSVAQECGPRTADARGCPCSSLPSGIKVTSTRIIALRSMRTRDPC